MLQFFLTVDIALSKCPFDCFLDCYLVGLIAVRNNHLLPPTPPHPIHRLPHRLLLPPLRPLHRLHQSLMRLFHSLLQNNTTPSLSLLQSLRLIFTRQDDSVLAGRVEEEGLFDELFCVGSLFIFSPANCLLNRKSRLLFTAQNSLFQIDLILALSYFHHPINGGLDFLSILLSLLHCLTVFSI